MLKSTSFYFMFFLFLLACNKKSDLQDVIKTNTIIKLQQKATSNHIDSNYIYLKKADRIIQKKSLISDSLKAENNYLLGLYFKEKGILDSASIYFHNATDYINDSIYTERQGIYFESAWNAFYSLEKYGDCLTISEKFKSLLNKEKQFRSLSWAYHFEESIYIKTQEYQKALSTNQQRVALAKAKDTIGLFSALVYQAKIKYYYLNNKEGAFAIMDSLISIKELFSNDQKRVLYGDIGIYNYWEEDYQKALNNYLISLHYTKQINGLEIKKDKLITQYNNIAEVQIKLENYNKAYKYLDTVASFGINNIKRRSQKNYLKYYLQLASLTKNNTGGITQYIDSIYNFQDKTYKEKFNTELIALKKSNASEKQLLKDKQLSEINNIQLRSRFLTVVILIILLAIFGFLFNRQRKYKFEKQKLQMQQRLLRSQMNPHFTFNTLYAIQNLIKKDPEKSTNYLLKFSRLLRLVLDNSINNYVQIENELESLRKYMDLQLLRFPKKFDYEIVLHHMKEDDLIFIPPMLLQPFVENSIEHGFSDINYVGKILITLRLQEKFIHCSIEDNGLGITKLNPKKGESSSTILISDFIEKATNSKIEVYNKKELSENQKGLLINFLIPYKSSNND